MTDDPTTPAPDPAEATHSTNAPPTARNGLPRTRLGKILAAGVVTVVVVAGTIGAVAWADRTRYDDAVEAARTAIDTYHRAEDRFRSAGASVPVVIEYSATQEAIAKLKTAGLGDQKALDSYQAQVPVVTELVANIPPELVDAAARTGSDLPDADTWQPPAELSLIEARTNSATVQTMALKKDTATLTEHLEQLQPETDQLQALQDAWAGTFPATAAELVKQNPSAGKKEKDQVTKTGAAAAETLTVKTVTGYRKAVDAMTASHTKAVKAKAAADRKAAEQTARDAGEDSWTNPDTGETSWTDDSDASDSGDSGTGSGGGGSSSGGGAGGGGNSGGGGGGGSNWQPLKVIPGGSLCDGVPGGQEVSYGGTLMPPPDALSYSTYEIPGYGWGVRWECDAGW